MLSIKKIAKTFSFASVALMVNLVFTNSVYSQEKKDEKFTLPYKVYPLLGSLNDRPVFNSNSPEIIKTEGILLSTFPPENKAYPNAHLNKTFQGEFDIFTHHIAVEREKGDFTNIYQGLLLKNPTKKTIKLVVLAASSYRSQPDAPFKPLEDYLENNEGKIYAGPGDRVSQDVLRDKNTFLAERHFEIKPNQHLLLMNESIPISVLSPPINGRTCLFKLRSTGPLYIADLALYEKNFLFFKQKPSLEDWINILNKGKLAEKRDKVPSPMDKPLEKGKPFIYGRVSGVAIGNKWRANLVNDFHKLTVPEKNQGYAFIVNALYNNTLGTKQNQSAFMEKRYDDTAYQAHANYGITYELSLPLYNDGEEAKEVSISFDSPIRIPENVEQKELSFYVNPPQKINFRGDIKVEHEDENFELEEKYIHLVQRFGQKGKELITINLKPKEKKMVRLSYIYPADATPPHIITVASK
jgi:hypothetical protein